jgi:D-alanyl-D-alanine carboxypeptidase (penicillin-binding protein 5/6)
MIGVPVALVGAVVFLSISLGGGGGGNNAGSACAADVPCAVLPAAATPAPTVAGHSLLTDLGAPPPSITAPAAVVLEEGCGAVLFSLDPHSERPPASVTKIVTALVVVDHAALSDIVPVTVNGAELSATSDATVMGLAPGQRLTVRDLLYGLLLPSGNDAALQLAEHVSGSVPAFVELMNQKAAQLGLEDSHFTNPHGLHDPAHYTSAYDIAMLGAELLKNPDLAEIVRTQTYQPAWDGPGLKNINLLLGLYPGAIGVKTGFTDEAGKTIVAAAERDGRRIVVSLLHSQELYIDAPLLLDWAFSSVAPACDGNALAAPSSTPVASSISATPAPEARATPSPAR